MVNDNIRFIAKVKSTDVQRLSRPIVCKGVYITISFNTFNLGMINRAFFFIMV